MLLISKGLLPAMCFPHMSAAALFIALHKLYSVFS